MARTAEKPKEGMGARVEKARIKRGWSQDDLAKLLNTTRSSIKNKELGIRPFSLEETKILCQEFHMTIDYLVNGHDTKNVPINEALGLDNEAIWVMKDYFIRESPEKMKGLSKAFASYGVLDAIALYMNQVTEKEGAYLSDNYRKDGLLVNCTMSQEFFEEVLGQHMVHMMHEAKTGTHDSSYFSAYEDFGFGRQEQKLAESSDFDDSDRADKE